MQDAAVMAAAIRGLGHRRARAPHTAGSSHAAAAVLASFDAIIGAAMLAVDPLGLDA